MDESEWLTAKRGDGNPSVPRMIGAGVDEPGAEWAHEDIDSGDVFPPMCPGWAVRQPLIVEICQSHKAFEKGALDALHPNISHAVAEGVIELSRAADDFNNQKMRATIRRSERNG